MFYDRRKALLPSILISLLISLVAGDHVSFANARTNDFESKSRSEYSSLETTGELVQFTSGGHVLGFNSDSVYITSGSHALREEFIGANRVIPIGDQPSSADGQTQPLAGVVVVHRP